MNPDRCLFPDSKRRQKKFDPRRPLLCADAVDDAVVVEDLAAAEVGVKRKTLRHVTYVSIVTL